jgi:hypothetical protein
MAHKHPPNGCKPSPKALLIVWSLAETSDIFGNLIGTQKVGQGEMDGRTAGIDVIVIFVPARGMFN